LRIALLLIRVFRRSYFEHFRRSENLTADLDMWLPTREDAVAIYARFCQSHYGINARERAEARAEQLGRRGDIDGEKIWREVAC
jgi:hypothetical protein